MDSAGVVVSLHLMSPKKQEVIQRSVDSKRDWPERSQGSFGSIKNLRESNNSGVFSVILAGKEIQGILLIN